MDCRTALELVEVVRPDSGDLAESELTSAAAHLESCRHCAKIFHGRKTLDRQLGRVIRDVPVPWNLKTNLLATVSDRPLAWTCQDDNSTSYVGSNAEIDTGTKSVQSLPTSPPVSIHCRRWFRLTVAIVVCLAVVFVAWYSPFWPESSLTLAKLEQETDLHLDQYADFDGSFRANLPSGWSDLRSLRVVRPKGLQLSGSDHVAALYGFQLQEMRRPIDGVLLVIEQSRVVEPPNIFTFISATTRYPQRSTAVAAWTEGGLVYICFVQGGGSEIEALQQEFAIMPT